MDVNGNLDAWLSYFDQDTLEIMIRRKGVFMNKSIKLDKRMFYPEYFLKEMEEKTDNQKKYFERWSN
jgi:hypothetical protein